MYFRKLCLTNRLYIFHAAGQRISAGRNSSGNGGRAVLQENVERTQAVQSEIGGKLTGQTGKDVCENRQDFGRGQRGQSVVMCRSQASTYRVLYKFSLLVNLIGLL